MPRYSKDTYLAMFALNMVPAPQWVIDLPDGDEQSIASAQKPVLPSTGKHNSAEQPNGKL